MTKVLFLVFIYGFIGFSYYFNQHKIEKEQMDMGSHDRSVEFLFPPEYTRVMSIGYEQLLCDFLWLRAVQYIPSMKEKRSPWLYNTLDTITTLDQKFKDAYTIGGIWLSIVADMGEEGIEFSKKGYVIYPLEWRLPFLIGFNYLYYFFEYRDAAEYMMKASILPEAPVYLRDLAVRLYAQAGDPQLAVDALYRMYEGAKDETVKKNLEIKLKKAIVERDLQLLEKAVKKHLGIKRRVPKSLEDLVEEGIIKEIPVEPFGGRYFLDARGNVKTSIPFDRLHVYQIERPERIDKEYPMRKQ